MQPIMLTSTLDASEQPIIFIAPSGDGAVPLLVRLHTWSADVTQENAIDELAAQRGWAVVRPNARGSNRTPEACASGLAIGDVLDAVEYARANANVDPRRIYLYGASGGGHMALMMACAAPKLWAGVSAWVPVTDLARWFAHSDSVGARYAKDIVACCGGKPGESPEIDEQYRLRSPLLHLHRATGVAIDINAGIRDGHPGGGSVPIEHTLRAFNELAAANGRPGKRLTEAQIEACTRTAQVPEELQAEAVRDRVYGERRVFLRRTAGPARVTIFDGGHEEIPGAGIAWLEKHVRRQPAPHVYPKAAACAWALLPTAGAAAATAH